MPFGGSLSQFYRDRARELRQLAEKCRTQSIKEQLEDIANQFDRLADQLAKGHLRQHDDGPMAARIRWPRAMNRRWSAHRRDTRPSVVSLSLF
jgi:hypothetical protein